MIIEDRLTDILSRVDSPTREDTLWLLSEVVALRLEILERDRPNGVL